MRWIITAVAICTTFLFVIKDTEGGQIAGQQKCGLATFKPARNVSQITTRLHSLVKYCERKIVEVEFRKMLLGRELNQTEFLNARSSQEKRAREKKMGELSEIISKLSKEISVLRQRITTTNNHRIQVTKRLTELSRRIKATIERMKQLISGIKGKQSHIEALNRRIAKERAKRRCFGRKRRSVEPRAPRVRRGFRIRRVVRKVARETRRVVKQVVTLPKCIVDNIVSRLTRSKEKAVRERDHLYQQLLQLQKEKVNIEGEGKKLIAQRNADTQTLKTLTTSFKTMQIKLFTNTRHKNNTNKHICLLTHRITELTKLLNLTEVRLKFLREAKTNILSILGQLKDIRTEKVADLEEMEEAGEDLLHDIKEINEAIKTSVETLIRITCGSNFTARYRIGRPLTVMRTIPRNCGFKGIKCVRVKTKRVCFLV